ncbi:(4Fe-4S)-binding protein [Micromonospora taraxaci]|uniref:(4Fe-4S)-binding protein n=1 Tax=Micromonospora taraxaci TaxID=1316803 RepID=UPI0033BABD8B
MSSATEKKTYEGQKITVTFEARRCLHAAECVRGLPEVFDPGQRPWIRPDGAEAERLAEVVRRCPSGALQYELVDGGAETRPNVGIPRDLGDPVGLLVAFDEAVSIDEARGSSPPVYPLPEVRPSTGRPPTSVPDRHRGGRCRI